MERAEVATDDTTVPASPLDDVLSGSGSRLIVGVGGTGKTTLLDGIAAGLVDRGTAFRRCGWASSDGSRLTGLVGLLGPGAAPEWDADPIKAERHAYELALAAADEVGVVLVDDAHRLDPSCLRILGMVARDQPDVRFIAAQRPHGPSGAVGNVTDALAIAGSPLVLGPLGQDQVAHLLEQELGRPPSHALVGHTCSLTGGIPRLVTLLAREWRDTAAPDLSSPVPEGTGPPAALVESLRSEIEHLSRPARDLLVTLTTSEDVDPEILERMVRSEDHLTGLGDVGSEVEAAGLVDAAGVLFPLVGEAVRRLVPAAERRRVQVRLARALREIGGPPPRVADMLVHAQARGREAVDIYLAAAEASLAEPDEALRWLARAEAAGAEAQELAGPRAQAVLRKGDVVPALRLADHALEGAQGDDARQPLEVSAAALGMAGHWRRSAEAYRRLAESFEPPHRRARCHLLRVPGLVATGDVAEARLALEAGRETAAHGPLNLEACAVLAEGLLESVGRDPAGSLERLLEAASLQETVSTEVPAPDGAAALAALAALHRCEFDLARQAVGRAGERRGFEGSPERLRLLRAWAALRVGDWTEVRSVVGRFGEEDATPSAPRDDLWREALAVGFARRCGTVDQLVRTWRRVRGVLLRHPVDLFALQPAGELIVAGARIGGLNEVRASIDAVNSLLSALEDPPLWSLQARWDQLQAAVAADDVEAAASAVAALRDLAPVEGPGAALVEGSEAWWDVLRGQVDEEGLRRAAQRLHSAGLPWEAARLAGAAAVRCRDPAMMRGLLAFARQLRTPLLRAPSTEEEDAPLSEREREIAGHILAGLTYREVGAQLYISPKTVEHHMASIRRKLGAGSRAELLDALRRLLAPQ